MLEADVVVSAKRAVYDPQTEQSPDDFFKNGSRADQVVLVCNEQELLALSGLRDIKTSVIELVERYAGVVVKLGPAGAIVATKKEYARVPAFITDSIFKIGSGDIFSAAIAFHWGEKRVALVEAASLASRAVAAYVSTREANLDSEYLLGLDLRPAPPAKGKRVYLAAPFFDLGQRRVVEDTRDILRRFGHDVQSPLHEVGTGPPDIIAPADIALLRSCDMVFCILDGMDPGTVFETGFARALGLPIVAFAERTASYEMTMFEGTGCQIFSDYTAAVYAVGWS